MYVCMYVQVDLMKRMNAKNNISMYVCMYVCMYARVDLMSFTNLISYLLEDVTGHIHDQIDGVSTTKRLLKHG